MKKLSLLLALVMLLTCVRITVFAEDPAIKESASGFYYIEAEGDRPRLSAASADKFIQVDGQWFKDMNGNGQLDAYEDWRLSSAERAENLVSLMNLNEKVGILGFGGIGGSNGITVTDLDNNQGGGTGDVSSVINPDHPAMTASADEPFVYVGETRYPSMRHQAQVMGIATYIGAMTGTPEDQLKVANAMQAIQEESRLGIPAVISGDRTYNTWGGMVDAAHYAFGVARDEELLYNLYSEYAKESVAIGYHQVFHGYGNEIGSFYGDDPNYIATMSALETRAYEDNGFNSHSKHFIARGGRNSYTAAQSPADLIDSWMVGWKAVVDAGTQWIMTNNSIGRTPGLITFMDKATYSILRDDLGYEGIICLDWPMSPTSLLGQTGTTVDGIDVSTLTLGERYTLILNVGVDMFSCGFEAAGTDISEFSGAFDMVYFPEVLLAEIEAGKYTEEELNVHVLRILKNKFDLGIFENPYRDWGEALEIIGSDEYKAEQFIPLSNEDVNRARRSEITAMEEQLMVESTILLKNDGILPLSADQKVYISSDSSLGQELLTAAFAEKAAVVESLEEADVCVIEVSSFNDAYELMIEDAQDAGVPVVIVFEGTNSSEPELQAFLDADALLMQTYRNTPDHGSSIGSFFRYVTPSVTAEMLYGEKEPTGKTLFELAYDSEGKTLSWGELQDDIGVDAKTRLYMAMLAKQNPNVEMPNNLGDVIVTDSFGISYSNPADIELCLLTVPLTIQTEEVDNGSSTVMQTTILNASPKAGEPFEINFVANNKGGAGLITVQVMDGDAVAAEKVVGLAENQFRVITVELVLEAGEHTIIVGDMSETIVVE